MDEQAVRSMRVTPRPIVGVSILIAYAAIFTIGFLASGISYDEVSDTTGNIIKAVVVPVGLGAAILLAVTHFLGWWRPVFRDEDRTPRWTLLIPASMAVAILAGLVTADWGGFASSYLVWLLIGTMAVGIAEETLFRGLLLASFRGAMSEVGVWFWTSLAFGLLHGLNILFGQGAVATLRQIVVAFVLGSVLYASRRATGTLVVPIVLHGLWDFATFLQSGAASTTAQGVQGITAYVTVILFIVAVVKRTLFPKAPTETRQLSTA